ncbi:hypothetical protein [Paenibacillus donghaensis]|uniref:Uncharacterized protein n=1 Tax=Paenibacillus donghaensis TaxID=414771 RepID=A0A2Z2K7C9_9BACL|nr:hypothetical protein [Paenibacillus donghaensis]ASA20917.1 hypothetical protein B9T62_09045 [Paenibacillus donghaensis]
MSMTPERVEEIKRDAHDGYEHSGAAITNEELRELLAALEEAQQQIKDIKKDKRKILAVHDEQCARSSEYYNELIFVKGHNARLLMNNQDLQRQLNTANECAALARREYLVQCQTNGDIRRELAEAQQQLAEEKKWRAVEHEVAGGYHRELVEAQQTIARLESENRRLGSLVPIVSMATELMSWRDPGGGKGQAEALQLIYRWALENPSPEYAMAKGNKEEACCSNPNVQTVNNDLVTNTTVCINCGRLYREGSDKS